MVDTTPMVAMHAVQKHFGALHVLKDIEFTVAPGEVVVVIGPSGSGKSTLCRAINRLETIDEGTIEIDGKRLPEEGKGLAQLRADVGMVFQSFNLFAHKSVLENVTLGPMKVRGMKKADAEKLAHELLDRGRHRRAGRQVSRPALRWPAAARGHRPRARDGAQGHAVRRAHLGSRPRDDQRGARHHDRPRRGRHDDDRRHPRDGVRPHRCRTVCSSWPTARSSRRTLPRISSPTRHRIEPRTSSARS